MSIIPTNMRPSTHFLSQKSKSFRFGKREKVDVIILQSMMLLIVNIYIINGDLTAEFSQPIELIELSPFCHNHTNKHNFQVIK